MSSGRGRRLLAVAGVGFVVGQVAAIADLVFVMWKEHLFPHEVLLLEVGSWALPMAAYNLALFLPLALLASRNVAHTCRRQAGSGVWQVFFFDPNGARVELDFAPEEPQQRAGAKAA